MNNKLPIAGCGSPIDFENKMARARFIQNSKSKTQDSFAFTLIELLVVIAIIGVLAAFTMPVIRSVMRSSYISHAQAEMNQLESAIESYKNTYGFYPPGNGDNVLTNQLYYELVGTTNTISSPLTFQTLDGVQSLKASDLPFAYGGVSGFVNCSKPGAGGENSPAAKNFIHELKPGQIGTMNANGIWITNFVTAIGGPDASYNPLNQSGQSPYPNPWRYRFPGIQNPNGYDLWIDLKIGGKTNLICNWNSKVQINVSSSTYAP